MVLRWRQRRCLTALLALCGLLCSASLGSAPLRLDVPNPSGGWLQTVDVDDGSRHQDPTSGPQTRAALDLAPAILAGQALVTPQVHVSPLWSLELDGCRQGYPDGLDRPPRLSL